MQESEFSTVQMTFPDKRTAMEVTKLLLDRRLIACANIFPVESSYWWEGKVERSEEWMAWMKINSEDFQAVKGLALKHHPYQVPCIVRYEIIEGHDGYLEWIKASTARPLED